MDTIKINVRREVVRCEICKQPKDFLYLSDFMYGQRLVFLDSKKEYAFINLVEDDVFFKYGEMIKDIINKECVQHTEELVNNFINKTFGIACDAIYGMNIDFTKGQKKCSYCGSIKFERNMIEPESLIEISVPVISHNKWEGLTEKQQEELVVIELKKEGLL